MPCPKTLKQGRQRPAPARRPAAGTHPAVVVVVHRVQVPLEELVLCRDQHVAGQAVRGLNSLEEVLLADACGEPE